MYALYSKIIKLKKFFYWDFIFRGIKGMICILSETGLLQCCYLGTDPVSTSIPSIMPTTVINIQDAEDQLAKLN